MTKTAEINEKIKYVQNEISSSQAALSQVASEISEHEASLKKEEGLQASCQDPEKFGDKVEYLRSQISTARRSQMFLLERISFLTKGLTETFVVRQTEVFFSIFIF